MRNSSGGSMKIQLILPEDNGSDIVKGTVLPPPIGLLKLGKIINENFPGYEVEVYDGNAEDLNRYDLDGDFIGLSLRMTNYENGIKLANRIRKEQRLVSDNQISKILVGGPSTNHVEKNILNLNESIDYVLPFKAEESIKHLFSFARSNKRGIITKPVDDFNDYPAIDHYNLVTPFVWKGDRTDSTMSAYPVEVENGCVRKKKCGFCSLDRNLSLLDPKKIEEQINSLNQKYGIDWMQMIIDTMAPGHAKMFSSTDIPDNVKTRSYSIPGMINATNIEHYKKLNMINMFKGYESVLVTDMYNPKGPDMKYSVLYALEEIDLLADNAIKIFGSFIFGLKGETEKSLEKNIELFERIAQHDNIVNIQASKVYPMVGSDYFRMCIEDGAVRKMYDSHPRTKTSLVSSDNVDYDVLSDAFVSRFTQIEPGRIGAALNNLKNKYQEKCVSFGQKKQ